MSDLSERLRRFVERERSGKTYVDRAVSKLPKSGLHDATCALLCKVGNGCGVEHACSVCGGDHGNTGPRATLRDEAGEDAGIECPNCGGVMVVVAVVNVIDNKRVVVCTDCGAKEER